VAGAEGFGVQIMTIKLKRSVDPETRVQICGSRQKGRGQISVNLARKANHMKK
jgi:hypothetical protein